MLRTPGSDAHTFAMQLTVNRLIALSVAASSVLALSILPGGHAVGAEVEGVRAWRSPERTRIVFDLDAEVSYQLIRLDEAEQILIDLEDSSVSEAFNDPGALRFVDGPVTGMRQTQGPAGVLRFVVELTAPVRPRGFTLPPIQQYGDRLVLDLYDAEPERAPVEASPAPDIAGRADAESGRPAVAPDQLRDIVVAISAGHGGEDPGAMVGSNREKDITLAISGYLHDRLRATPGFHPVMIREGDYSVALRRRAEIARDHRADLLVAIHADSYRSSSADGLTIYALSGDRADRENAARVARKENTADLIAGVDSDLRLKEFDDDVALALVSVHMGWSLEQSQFAGNHILQAAGKVTRLRRDKVQQASLQVLNSPDIPSILIETGYMTNPAELKELTSAPYQRRLADAFASGIMGYFDERAPEGTLIAWQQANGGAEAAAPPLSDEVASMATTLVNALVDAEAEGDDTEPQREGVDSYMVQRGDTLSEIANRYSVSLSRLRELNQLSNDRIAVGKVLKIPR